MTVDDEANSPIGAGASPESPRRRRAIALVSVLVALSVGVLWVVAAARATNHYGAEAGPDVGECVGSFDDAIDALQSQLDQLRDDGDLAVVAKAFRDHFSTSRWTIVDDGVTISRDGSTLGVRQHDGWQGLLRGDERVAHLPGERFWIRDCANVDVALLPIMGGGTDRISVQCVEQAAVRDTIVTSWTSSDADSCDQGIYYQVTTTKEGKLLRWTAQYGEVRPVATASVRAPQDLAWPSPIWIIPTWLGDRR